MLHYIVLSIILLVGLVLTVAQEALGRQSLVYPYLVAASSTLLISGTLSLFYKVFVDSVSDKRLRDLLRIHDSVERTGLNEVVSDGKRYDFGPLIRKSHDLYVVLNYGLGSLSAYAVDFTERFSRKGTHTEVYLVDAEGLFFPALAQKIGKTPLTLKTIIEQSASELVSFFSASSRAGTLTVYAMHNYPLQSVFAFDDLVFLTHYRMSSSIRDIIPLYVYNQSLHEGTVTALVMKDIRALKNEARIIFDSSAITASASTSQEISSGSPERVQPDHALHPAASDSVHGRG